MIGLRHLSRRAPLPVYAAALSSLAISACAKKQERAQRPVAMVSVVAARRATVPYIIESNGIVTPVQTVSVTPQVDGIIQSVDFQEGQEVRPGQSLFHIDARPYQNAYDQAARRSRARQRDRGSHADVNAKRYKDLLAAKVITPQEAEVQFTSAATTECDAAGGSRRGRAGEIQPRQRHRSGADPGPHGQRARQARQPRSLRRGRTARRDQPGSTDLRPLLDSVVRSCRWCSSTARPADCRSRRCRAASRRPRRRSIPSRPRR